jgi:outer membrane protein assembly factor BamB
MMKTTDDCRNASRSKFELFTQIGSASRFFGGALLGLALISCNGATRPTHSGPRSATIDSVNWLMFHGDRQRSGWNANETILSPASLDAGNFGVLWDMLNPLDGDGSGNPPHLYAAPLYAENVVLTTPDLMGLPFSVVFAATNSNYVYAICAIDPNRVVPPGSILWRQYLGPASCCYDSIVQGVYGTPVIDVNASPPRMYVAADTNRAPEGRKWRVFALDITNGNVLSGWPLIIDNSTVGDAAPPGILQNGPAHFEATDTMSQRGGLNLSFDGSVLYVPFGGYSDSAAGFMVAIATGVASGNPVIQSAFAGGRSSGAANGGMWGSGGPAIDSDGRVYMTTGNNINQNGPALGIWGESILAWGPNSPLQLVGTYTPWNYCQMDYWDTDLSGTAPIVIDLDPARTSTPHLLSFGGKGGNAYLVDRDNMPGRLDHRPNCHWISSDVNRPLDPTAAPADGSLFGPELRSYYRSEDGLNQPRPGPLNAFGPYTEGPTCCNHARGRSTPAFMQDADGTVYVFFTGSTRRAVGDETPVSPSVVRTKINMPGADQRSYLTFDAMDNSIIFRSPGSPVISSNGSDLGSAIVWVLEPNVMRGDGLPTSVHATLYAIAASSMTPIRVVYTSPDVLHSGGKYSHPIVASGVLYAGTDRITAFGLLGGGGR